MYFLAPKLRAMRIDVPWQYRGTYVDREAFLFSHQCKGLWLLVMVGLAEAPCTHEGKNHAASQSEADWRDS